MTELVRALEERRAEEKAQAVFYRALAVSAEASGDEALAQRLHGLHADEQHHLSRLTARLVELGVTPVELFGARSARSDSENWEAEAREREEREVEAYETLAARAMDERTRELIGEILAVERHHARELGGKWTLA